MAEGGGRKKGLGQAVARQPAGHEFQNLNSQKVLNGGQRIDFEREGGVGHNK